VERQKKMVLEPLFKSYVFVHVTENKRWELLNIPGIINYVTWLGKPARIKEAEISTIRKFLKEFDTIEVVEGPLEINAKVKVTQGVLMNYHGILLQISGNRASVKIESMGLQLITLIDKKKPGINRTGKRLMALFKIVAGLLIKLRSLLLLYYIFSKSCLIFLRKKLCRRPLFCLLQQIYIRIFYPG
jgi:hypothetical protein